MRRHGKASGIAPTALNFLYGTLGILQRPLTFPHTTALVVDLY